MNRRTVFVRNTLAIALAAVVGGSYVYFRGAELPGAQAAILSAPVAVAASAAGAPVSGLIKSPGTAVR